MTTKIARCLSMIMKHYFRLHRERALLLGGEQEEGEQQQKQQQQTLPLPDRKVACHRYGGEATRREKLERKKLCRWRKHPWLLSGRG